MKHKWAAYLALAALASAIPFTLPHDQELFRAVSGGAGETSHHVAEFFSRYGRLEWSTLCVALVLTLAGRLGLPGRRQKLYLAAKGCFLAGLAAGLLVWPGKMLLGRERPQGGKGTGGLHGARFALVGETLYHSMPSGHSASSSGSMVACLILYPPSGVVLVPAAAAVGWSRVKLGKHWPSDVLAGWLLGGTVGLVIGRLLRRQHALKLKLAEKLLPSQAALSHD